MSERTLADLLDELSQAAESSATAYEHGSLGEAKERDKYVRALKVDILAMFTEVLAAHPAPPATAGEDDPVAAWDNWRAKWYPLIAGRVIALGELGEEKAEARWNECAAELIALPCAPLQRAAGGGA